MTAHAQVVILCNEYSGEVDVVRAPKGVQIEVRLIRPYTSSESRWCQEQGFPVHQHPDGYYYWRYRFNGKERTQ